MTASPDRNESEPEDDIEFVHPGLARERTRLAWTRSAISFAAIGVVLLKDRPLIGAPLLIFSAAIWWIGRTQHGPEAPAALVPRRVLLVTVGVIVMALAALTIVVLGHQAHGLKL